MNNINKQFISIIFIFALIVNVAFAEENGLIEILDNSQPYYQQTQPLTPPSPPAYTENPLPNQINLNLMVNGRSYTNPSNDLLKTLYGANYKSSVYYRTKEALTKDTELRRHYARLQATRGHDITVNVYYDNEADLIPGETFSHYNPATKKFATETVKKGDTLASIAKRMGVTKEELLKSKFNRFNVWPHARWQQGTVNIGESWRDYPDETLYETLAHEAAHTADGTCYFPQNYGNDDKHSLAEVTDRSTAWTEGWAIYNGGIFSPIHRQQINNSAHYMVKETEDSQPGDPIYEHYSSPHFMTRLRNEGTVAAILTNIDGNGKYRDNVMNILKQGNQNWVTNSLSNRDIVTFTNDYMNANPGQRMRTMLAIDCATNFTSDDDRLRKLFGVHAEEYLKERTKYIVAYHEANNKTEMMNNLEFFAKWDKTIKVSEPTIAVQPAGLLGAPSDEEVQLDPMELLNENS